MLLHNLIEDAALWSLVQKSRKYWAGQVRFRLAIKHSKSISLANNTSDSFYRGLSYDFSTGFGSKLNFLGQRICWWVFCQKRSFKEIGITFNNKFLFFVEENSCWSFPGGRCRLSSLIGFWWHRWEAFDHHGSLTYSSTHTHTQTYTMTHMHKALFL